MAGSRKIEASYPEVPRDWQVVSYDRERGKRYFVEHKVAGDWKGGRYTGGRNIGVGGDTLQEAIAKAWECARNM